MLERKPRIVSSQTLLSNSNTAHCTGRTNSSLLIPQRIRFGIGRFANDWFITDASKSRVASPGTIWRRQSLSCCPSFSTNLARSSIARLFFLAKASAALVGTPSLLKAIFTGGPQEIVFRSGVTISRPLTVSASLLGAAKEDNVIHVKFFSDRALVMFSSNAADSVISAFGGNSSVPSSNNKSAFIGHHLTVELKRFLQYLDWPRETQLSFERQSNPVPLSALAFEPAE